MHDPRLRFNYSIQWVIMILIIFGGLGYHIAYNVIQYIKKFFINIFSKKNRVFISRVINLNTKIVLYTTLILILSGGAFFFISEQQTSLLEHNKIGRASCRERV